MYSFIGFCIEITCIFVGVRKQTFMKKIAIVLLILSMFTHLSAQTDYLDPVDDFNKYKGELGEYYRDVFALLDTGFSPSPYARFTVIPSFSPEYAMSVEQRKGNYCLVSHTLTCSYWQAPKEKVGMVECVVPITSALYRSLGELFRLVTNQIQDVDGYAGGLDGTTYYFAATNPQGKVIKGKKWSPSTSTLMGRLVLVCESSYLLIQGKDITEASILNETEALIIDLKARAKELPEEYKIPKYIGAYSVGLQVTLAAGQTLDKEPSFPEGVPEEYALQQLRYPEQLLAKGIKGYVICEFTIDKEGTVLHPYILQSTHPEFAEEALRIVKGMPEWIPARVNSKPVECKYALYIPFRPNDYKKRLQKK